MTPENQTAVYGQDTEHHASATGGGPAESSVRLTKQQLRKAVKHQDKARLSGRVVARASVWNRRRRRREPIGYAQHLRDLAEAGKADAERAKAVELGKQLEARVEAADLEAGDVISMTTVSKQTIPATAPEAEQKGGEYD